jgi:hypothetical protein
MILFSRWFHGRLLQGNLERRWTGPRPGLPGILGARPRELQPRQWRHDGTPSQDDVTERPQGLPADKSHSLGRQVDRQRASYAPDAFHAAHSQAKPVELHPRKTNS